jgi:hypothetical protein
MSTIHYCEKNNYGMSRGIECGAIGTAVDAFRYDEIPIQMIAPPQLQFRLVAVKTGSRKISNILLSCSSKLLAVYLFG